MHGSKKRLTPVAGVCIAALALSACAESERSPSSGDGGGGGGGTFVFGAAGDPGTLDPAFATDGETFRVTRQLFEGARGRRGIGATRARTGRVLGS